MSASGQKLPSGRLELMSASVRTNVAIAQRSPRYRQKGAQAQTTQLLNLIASSRGIQASRAFAGRSHKNPEADFDLMLFNRVN